MAKAKKAKGVHIPAKAITLPEWVAASGEQRSSWMLENRFLDDYSRETLRWADRFRNAGAVISVKCMLGAYSHTVGSMQG